VEETVIGAAAEGANEEGREYCLASTSRLHLPCLSEITRDTVPPYLISLAQTPHIQSKARKERDTASSDST
jgi:hypothetical protein